MLIVSVVEHTNTTANTHHISVDFLVIDIGILEVSKIEQNVRVPDIQLTNETGSVIGSTWVRDDDDDAISYPYRSVCVHVMYLYVRYANVPCTDRE